MQMRASDAARHVHMLACLLVGVRVRHMILWWQVAGGRWQVAGGSNELNSNSANA